MSCPRSPFGTAGVGTAFLLLAALVRPGPAEAQGPLPIEVEGQPLAANADRVTIISNGKRRYTQLRLCSLGAPIRLIDVDVVFGNGKRQDIQTRDLMEAGACTRPHDLQGDRRDIARMEVRYQRVEGVERAPVLRLQAR